MNSGKTATRGIGEHVSLSENTDTDMAAMMEKNPCYKQYEILEECLGENNRKWTLCQKEVQALKLCSSQQERK